MRIAVSGLAISVSLALAFSSQAVADKRAVYETPDGELVIDYRDDDHIRYGLPDGGFLLITGGDAYALHRDEGRWTAVSADQIREMVQGGDDAGEQVRFTSLGERRTVAGVRGEVFRVEVGDEWADEWREDGQAVLSDDPRVNHLGRAFRRMVEAFGNVSDESSFNDAIGIDINEYGLLEAEDMRLTSVSTESRSDRYFQLPPNVQHQELPTQARRPDASERRERGAGRDEDSQPGWLGEQMRGTGEDARDEAAGETRREVRDGVREGVRGLFR